MVDLDWKKQVSISPITGLTFTPTAEDETKGETSIKIKNNSAKSLVFKVRVTCPDNYMVRPNIAIVKPTSEYKIIITLGMPLDSEAEAIAMKKDKF